MGRSRTAVLVAGYRARESARPTPVCNDPWAEALAGPEAAELVTQFDVSQPDLGLWIAIRTAHLDARVTDLIERGAFGQVVILGAGLDTRAARLARDGVRFFEVDRPETQADKLERLAAADGYPPEAAVHVACNFEHQDFLEQLVKAGFDTERPAAIVWEGATPYLTEDAVRATLSRIAQRCHPRTTVLFDHIGERLARGAIRNPDDLQTRDVLVDLDEPIRWGSDDPLPMLYDVGFRRVRVRSFDELALELTGTYDRARKWRFSHIAEASVADPKEAR